MNLPKPGALGRLVRLGLGLASLALLGWIALAWRPGRPLPLTGLWVWLGSAHALHYLPYTLTVPFGRARDRRVLGPALAMLALAAGVDGLTAGGAWLALAWGALAGYSTLVTGVSYVTAAALAVPG